MTLAVTALALSGSGDVRSVSRIRRGNSPSLNQRRRRYGRLAGIAAGSAVRIKQSQHGVDVDQIGAELGEALLGGLYLAGQLGALGAERGDHMRLGHLDLPYAARCQ